MEHEIIGYVEVYRKKPNDKRYARLSDALKFASDQCFGVYRTYGFFKNEYGDYQLDSLYRMIISKNMKYVMALSGGSFRYLGKIYEYNKNKIAYKQETKFDKYKKYSNEINELKNKIEELKIERHKIFE
jgi:hypothetical protein